MTKVTVELKNKAVNASVEIKQGQYVEIDGFMYICTHLIINNEVHSQLNHLISGHRWDSPQKGYKYIYSDKHPIRFIDKIKITEE